MVDVIQELGHLNKLAKEDHSKRFNRLYRLLRQEAFLEMAKQNDPYDGPSHFAADI